MRFGHLHALVAADRHVEVAAPVLAVQPVEAGAVEPDEAGGVARAVVRPGVERVADGLVVRRVVLDGQAIELVEHVVDAVADGAVQLDELAVRVGQHRRAHPPGRGAVQV